MTATLDDVATRKKGKPEPTAEQKLAEELVARAREQGVSLTGPEGLLKQLTKAVLETALNQEMTEHLGHDKHSPPGNETGNVRNGIRPKTVLTEASGQVGIDVPRDRAGTFEPQIVKKRQRRQDVGPAGPTSKLGQTSRGHSRRCAPGQRAEALGHPATGRGRLRADAGPPWVGCQSRGRGRRRFTACLGTADGVRHRMEHYRGQCCHGAAAAGAAASRSLPGRPGGRRPERDVMRALVVAERSGKVRRIRRLPA
jgi:hypothetical protein